jgi:hypothetical protein
MILFQIKIISCLYGLGVFEHDIPNVEKLNILPFDLTGTYHMRVDEGYITLTIFESNKYAISSSHYDSLGIASYGHILVESDGYYLLPLKSDPYFKTKTKLYHNKDTITLVDSINRNILLTKDRMLDLSIINTTYNLTRRTSKRVYELSNNSIELNTPIKYDLEIINGRVIIYNYYSGEFVINATYGYLHIVKQGDTTMSGEIISDSFNFISSNDGIVKIEVSQDEIKLTVPINAEGEAALRQQNRNYTDEMESPLFRIILF